MFDEEIFKSFVDGLTIALKGLDAFLVSLQGGLNQIIYLSSFVANIFQNQIGKFLAENQLKKAKQFLINEQEIEYLNALKDQLDTVYKTEDAALKVEYEYLQKIFELKSNMTEDEHKTSLEVAKRIAQREVELQDIQAVQAILQSGADYNQIEKSQIAAASKKESQRISTQALSEAMNISGTFQSAESDKEFKAYYQTESEAMSEIGRVLNIEINARKEKIELLQKDIDLIKEQKVLNEDDEALLRNKSIEQKKIRDEEYEYIRIKKKIQKGETISVDQASKLKETIENQVKELQKEENAHQRVADTAKKMKKDGEGYVKSVKEAQKADKDNLGDVIERNSYISKSQQKVSMITTSLSSLTGIFGGIKTLFNPDLSG